MVSYSAFMRPVTGRYRPVGDVSGGAGDRFAGAAGWCWRATAALAVLVVIVVLARPVSSAAAEEDARSGSNRQFVTAMRLIERADRSYDRAEESRLLKEAEHLLQDIVERFPETDLAVQLVTNQFIGDFDFFEFRNRVRALVCDNPLDSGCFLFRIATLLPPVESPITTARWDWLSLAVAYHHITKETDRARDMLAPFLSAVRRGPPAQGSEPDLFVSRALALTGQPDLALELTRAYPQCSTRIYNLTDIAQALVWQGDRPRAVELAAEARRYAQEHNCVQEAGLVLHAALLTGDVETARGLFNTYMQSHGAAARVRGGRDCCQPEFAVAAAEFAEPNTALALLRGAQDENPWAIPAVLGRLVRRGERGVAIPYGEQIGDLDLRGETFAELVRVLVELNDTAAARTMMERLVALTAEAASRRPSLYAQRAKAERWLYQDERWRRSFQEAVTAAERGSSFVKRDIGGPLLATLVHIVIGHPLLD